VFLLNSDVRKKDMKKLIVIFVITVVSCGCLSVQKARPIEIGMSMERVINLKGKHFRVFSGPRSGHIAMIYDDITIHVEDRMAEYASGTVHKIEKTSPHITEWVEKTEYEDTKKAIPNK
jgi:hypothetical protein